jgi:hypothetical protein
MRKGQRMQFEMKIWRLAALLTIVGVLASIGLATVISAIAEIAR